MTQALAKTQEHALDTVGAIKTESSVIMNQLTQEGVQLLPGVDQDFRFQLPRLGKLRLGIKALAQSGKEYPKATEYFVLPQELLDNSDFMAELSKYNADPAKPVKLPIYLPCNAIAGNMRRSADLYGSSKGLLCRTYNGEICERVNQKTGEWSQCECSMHTGCQEFEKKNCHWIHRLRVVLPDAPGIGVWQIDSTSKNNWATLNSEMGAIKGQLGGKLAGVDLFLTLEPREFQVSMTDYKTKEKKLQKTTTWLMHIRSDMNLRKLKEAAQNAVGYDDATIEWDETYDDMSDVGDYTPTDDDGNFEVGEPENPPATEPEHIDAEFTPEPDMSDAEKEKTINDCKALQVALNLANSDLARLISELALPAKIKDFTFDNAKTLYNKLYAIAQQRVDDDQDPFNFD